MSLILEYGDRKEQKGIEKGIEEVIKSLLKSGMTCEDISQRINKPLKDIYKIADKL